MDPTFRVNQEHKKAGKLDTPPLHVSGTSTQGPVTTRSKVHPRRPSGRGLPGWNDLRRVLRGDILRMEPGEFHHIVDVVGLVAHGLFRTQLPCMAAALAYRTVFGIIPMLAVGLVVLGSFASEDQIAHSLNLLFDFTGVSRIVVEAPENVPFTPLPVAEGASGQSQDFTGEDRLAAWIKELADRVRASPLTTLGVIGLVALVYAAISTMVEMEHAFNQIYRTVGERSWGARITRYWSLITLGSLFLIATFYVGEQFKSWVAKLVENEALGGFGSIALTFLAFTVTVAISTLLWMLFYTTVPATHVRLRPALAGAVVAAILWETCKWAFTHYLAYTAGYSKVYGSIALIPIFLIWIYVTWLIVLFGLSISYALQHFRTWRETQSKREGLTPFVDPEAVLLVMAETVARYRSGKVADAESIGDSLGMSENATGLMLTSLSEAGLLLKVDDPGGTTNPTIRFVPARPPEQISAEEVLRVGRTMTAPTRLDGAGGILEWLRETQIQAVAGRSINEFVEAASSVNATKVESV